MHEPRTQITRLLNAVGSGDGAAAEQLWHVVYDELHRVAHARMTREARRGDVNTTVLVQEVYLRLMGRDGTPSFANRRHFFAAAANAMRQFLVDDARKRGRAKRGGGRAPLELGAGDAVVDYDPADVLALDEALVRLRAQDARQAEIVALRYFAGLTVDETAEVLDISPSLVTREWRHARAMLHRELGAPPPERSPS